MTRIILLIALLSLATTTLSEASAANRKQGKRIGFTLDNQFRKEDNDGNGGVIGEYGVRTGDGCLRVTRYKATKRGGFKVISTRKEDCDPRRVLSRVTVAPSRPKVISAALENRPSKSLARNTPRKETKLNKKLPRIQTTVPPPRSRTTTRRRNLATAQTPVNRKAFVVNGQKTTKPFLTKPSKPTPQRANKKANNKSKPKKSRRNRPKQLKKDFDFKALSAGNPARPLDKKEDPVYSFGFTAPGHGHTQAGLADGSKKGEYYFDSPDGWRRIVTYVANEKGFFPKMRRVRIPGWTSTTPAPRVSRNRNRGTNPEDDLTNKSFNGNSRNNGGNAGNNLNGHDREGRRFTGSDGEGRGGGGDIGDSVPGNRDGRNGNFDDFGEGGNNGQGNNGGGRGSSDGRGGSDGKGGRNGDSGGRGGSGGRDGNQDDDLAGKQLLDNLRNAGVGSCPYYFFYNTKVNFHWERCMENQTKVGQYGRLHEDGFSYRTSYYADRTGYHPTSTKIPLTDEQSEIVHEFTEGVFILPKPDEERLETEQRILEWLDQNRDLLRNPLAR